MPIRLRAHGTISLALSMLRALLEDRTGSLLPAGTQHSLREKSTKCGCLPEHTGTAKAAPPHSLPPPTPVSCALARTEFGFDHALPKRAKANDSQTPAPPRPSPQYLVTLRPPPPRGAVFAGNGLRAQRKSFVQMSLRKALVSRKEKQRLDLNHNI